MYFHLGSFYSREYFETTEELIVVFLERMAEIAVENGPVYFQVNKTI
jgi:hypothetical protein